MNPSDTKKLLSRYIDLLTRLSSLEKRSHQLPGQDLHKELEDIKSKINELESSNE